MTDFRTRPGENADIVYQMADYMFDKGARCGNETADHERRICIVSPTVAYAEVPLDKMGGTLTTSISLRRDDIARDDGDLLRRLRRRGGLLPPGRGMWEAALRPIRSAR